MKVGDKIDTEFLEHCFKNDTATLREYYQYTFGCGCYVIIANDTDEALEFEVCSSDHCERERAKTNYGKDNPF